MHSRTQEPSRGQVNSTPQTKMGMVRDHHRSVTVAKNSALTRAKSTTSVTYGALMRRRWKSSCEMTRWVMMRFRRVHQPDPIRKVFEEATAKLVALYLCDRCCFWSSIAVSVVVLGRKVQQPTNPQTTNDMYMRQVMAILDGLDTKGRQIALLAFVDGLSQRNREALGWSSNLNKMQEIKSMRDWFWRR